MHRLLMLSLTCTLVVGCKDDAEPVASDEPAAEPAVEEARAEAPVEAPAEAGDEPREEPALELATPVAVDPIENAGMQAEATAAVVQPAPRDLATELRTAVGAPVDCVKDFQPSSARTIRVDVRGVVRPTGMIIEPSASGGGLSRNDLRCIEERIGNVVLSPIGGEVSEPVSTFIELEYTPPEIESFEVAPPPPPAENVVPSLPKKDPIAPSGQPIDGPAPKPIEGPSGEPIDGPEAVPIEGPAPVPIGR